MKMIIEQLTQNDENLWDDYVLKTDGATFYHLIGWKKLVEKVLRFKSIYLAAKEGPEIVGILPLFLTKNLFFGRKLISVPFAVAGGVCTNSDEAASALINRAIEVTKELNLDYLELRHADEKRGQLITSSNYVNFILDLDSGPDHIWKNLRSSLRRCIRRSMENGLEIELEATDIDEFYKLYSMGQRNFGTPIQGYNWIKNLFCSLQKYHSIVKVRYKNETIAISMVRKFKGSVSEILGYDLRNYRNLYPNHFLEWKLIEDSCHQNYKTFEFGRSLPDSGTYYFKKGWAAKPTPLYYQYYLNNVKAVPDLSQNNPKRQRFAKMWRMMPLPMANMIGPIIRGCFP